MRIVTQFFLISIAIASSAYAQAPGPGQPSSKWDAVVITGRTGHFADKPGADALGATVSAVGLPRTGGVETFRALPQRLDLADGTLGALYAGHEQLHLRRPLNDERSYPAFHSWWSRSESPRGRNASSEWFGHSTFTFSALPGCEVKGRVKVSFFGRGKKGRADRVRTVASASINYINAKARASAQITWTEADGFGLYSRQEPPFTLTGRKEVSVTIGSHGECVSNGGTALSRGRVEATFIPDSVRCRRPDGSTLELH